MNTELQWKLSAWLDGELPEREAREVATLVQADANAAALVAELRHTCAALQTGEPEVKLPESREFYWSKIRREIERQEAASLTASAAPVSWLAQLRRWLVPAGAVAALVLVGLFASRSLTPDQVLSAYELDGVIAGTETFTFTDERSGTTLIWFSYPAENEFTNGDTPGIL
jgi:anti-sigma factor RsiW